MTIIKKKDSKYRVHLKDGWNHYSLICIKVDGKYIEESTGEPLDYTKIYWVE